MNKPSTAPSATDGADTSDEAPRVHVPQVGDKQQKGHAHLRAACWLIRVFPAWICSGLAACDGPTSMLLDADRPTALPGRLFERCEALDSNITDLDVPSPGCRAPGGAELGRPTAIAISDAAIPLAYPAPLSSLANLTAVVDNQEAGC